LPPKSDLSLQAGVLGWRGKFHPGEEVALLGGDGAGAGSGLLIDRKVDVLDLAQQLGLATAAGTDQQDQLAGDLAGQLQLPILVQDHQQSTV